MADVYLVLDESGAKGFAKNSERVEGELGVIAGYFVRAKHIDRVRRDFEDIRGKLPVEAGAKSHVTELDAEQQRLTRIAVFEYLLDHEMATIYEATYVQGLHEATNRMNEISEDALEARRSDVRVSYRPENDRLLSVMFQMIFGKAAAYAVDYFGKNVTLQIIMDRTDAGLLREFREKATEFLDAGKPKQRELTGYDIVRKEKVTETATIHVTGPDVERALGDFRNFSYDISCEDSGLTFAADVISNSIRHHLSQKVQQGVPVDLNSKEAIGGHKLEHLFYGLSDGKTFESLTDIMYRHPNGNRRDPEAQGAEGDGR